MANVRFENVTVSYGNHTVLKNSAELGFRQITALCQFPDPYFFRIAAGNIIQSRSNRIFAFLSINVGFINLLPLPAFDGGHILFLIIEKIKRSPVKPETEAKFHTVGLFLLMALMVYITFNDIFFRDNKCSMFYQQSFLSPFY